VAQKSADTLRISMRDALPNIDPYYNNLRTGVVMHHQGGTRWSTAIPTPSSSSRCSPPNGSCPIPPRSSSRCGPGVKFHDGSPLTADDVVYTLNLASDPPARCRRPRTTTGSKRRRRPASSRCAVKLKRPDPAALEYFALVLPIYPKAYREKVGPKATAKAPVGAGPYR
jgi:peptide/nickel transport system substrate-binding protein